MATPQNDSYSCPLGGVVAAGLWPSPPVQQVVANGCWTWYNDNRAVYHNGKTYVGSLTSAGSVQISAVDHDSETVSTTTLSAALQVDDHCVPCPVVMPNGKIVPFYAKNQDTGVRYKVSNSAESIAAFGAEQLLPGMTAALAYANPRLLADVGVLALFSRAVIDVNTRKHFYRITTDLDTVAAGSWSAAKYFFDAGPNTIPYGICTAKGDEIHWSMTDLHPKQGQVDLYHFYAKWHAGDGDFRWYRTDGTLIATKDTLPFGPADCTLVYDGAAARCWNWSITVDANNRPRVLFTKYPNNNGTVIKMMYSRWDGAAWTVPVQVGNDDSSLYAEEQYYASGACFDARNPDRCVLGNKVGSVREMQEWDLSSTPVKLRDITSGTAAGVINARPISPVGNNGRLRYLWWSGTYNSYSSYSTAVKAA